MMKWEARKAKFRKDFEREMFDKLLAKFNLIAGPDVAVSVEGLADVLLTRHQAELAAVRSERDDRNSALSALMKQRDEANQTLKKALDTVDPERKTSGPIYNAAAALLVSLYENCQGAAKAIHDAGFTLKGTELVGTAALKTAIESKLLERFWGRAAFDLAELAGFNMNLIGRTPGEFVSMLARCVELLQQQRARQIEATAQSESQLKERIKYMESQVEVCRQQAEAEEALRKALEKHLQDLRAMLRHPIRNALDLFFQAL